MSTPETPDAHTPTPRGRTAPATLAALALLLAALAPAIAAPPLAPTSQQKAQTWNYTLTAPPAGWEKPDFTDPTWKKGPGGFGSTGESRTKWTTSDIWLRRTFDLKKVPTGDVQIYIFHDEDAEIYINGVLAAQFKGFITEYISSPVNAAGKAALKVGTNVLAVHCKQTGGGQYIDVGLGTGPLINELKGTDLKSLVFNDWLFQDASGNTGVFSSEEDAKAEKAAVEAALQELGDEGKAYRPQLDALASAKGSDPRWRELYTKVCEARRALRLKPLLAKWQKFAFAKHWNVGGSHYAYTECQSDAQAERHWVPGAALCILDQKGLYGEVETLIDDPKGIIRNPDVSYDGKRILFSWKKDDRKDDYHLYEWDVAAKKVRPITDGLGYADYEGCYLPNGDIIFNSTRCVQIVDCWWTEVSNLYTCDKDGKYLRRLGYDQVHTNFPTTTDDGRILYTRWDYNDRGQLFPQPLFQMYFDGTAQTECYGNNSWFPTTIIHARQIPGTPKIVGIATGHHSDQSGKLLLIDPAKGRQENQGAQLIAPPRNTPADRIDGYGQDGDQFQYPYPLDETHYLVTYAPTDPGREGLKGFGLYFMDIDGKRELLAWDPKISSNQAIPLAPRPKGHVRPSTVDYRKATGTYYVQDIYQGPGLKGIPRGTIKSLRVVALDYRIAGIGSNGNGGPAGGALVSTPVSINNGTWDVKKVLGSVPIEPDGSAYFTVPARTPVYFQLLDEKGYVVQSMRTWSTLQPGETFACVGCHENKNEAAPFVTGAATTKSLLKPPQELRPFYGPVRGFSYPKEIQPIWDKKCISCHTGEAGKPVSLLGKAKLDDKSKRNWSESYLNLVKNGNPNPIVNWLNVQSIPPMLPPNFAGACKSKLMDILEKGHYDVKMTREEMEKIACWIDLLIPFCGDYREAAAWSADENQKYDRYQKKRKEQDDLDQKNIKALIADKPKT